MRRGRPTTFPSSQSLDACPRLRERGTCSALCIPVNFMGKTLGVLHVTAEEHAPPGGTEQESLEALAGIVSTRVGSVRTLEQIQLQASTDPLTGLFNRRALEEQVRSLILDGTRFAVAICDLDHFKKLNDTHGHDMGDHALTTFSKVVREATRDGDLISRFGGEEFVIVFPDADAEEAAWVLERVRQHLARVTAGNDTPTFTSSYGVSDSRCGSDLSALITIADAALLRAKDEGRDRIIIADMGEADAAPPPILRPDEKVA